MIIGNSSKKSIEFEKKNAFLFIIILKHIIFFFHSSKTIITPNQRKHLAKENSIYGRRK
jgi:hypothetical protein